MNYTENYQLPQWEDADRILRTDFNEGFQKLDAALEILSLEQINMGSYIGDGTDDRIIPLPFEPKILLVFGSIYTSNAINILTQDFNAYVSSSCGRNSIYNITLEGDSLRIRNREWNNQSGETIPYIAIR